MLPFIDYRKHLFILFNIIKIGSIKPGILEKKNRSWDREFSKFTRQAKKKSLAKLKNSLALLLEGNVLFNDALNTFYLRLYGARHMVKDHSDSEKGNPLSPHRLLFPINSKGYFICTIPQTG